MGPWQGAERAPVLQRQTVADMDDRASMGWREGAGQEAEQATEGLGKGWVVGGAREELRGMATGAGGAGKERQGRAWVEDLARMTWAEEGGWVAATSFHAPRTTPDVSAGGCSSRLTIATHAIRRACCGRRPFASFADAVDDLEHCLRVVVHLVPSTWNHPPGRKYARRAHGHALRLR